MGLTIYDDTDHDSWNRTYSNPIFWDWLFSQSKEAVSAYAGQDQFISLPSAGTTLNGSGFTREGVITTYQWSKISGPEVTTDGANTPTLSLTDLNEGTYIFQLEVVNNLGVSAVDQVQVIADIPNQLPSADAGLDLMSSDTVVVLDGSNSADIDGSITSYSWKIASFPLDTLGPSRDFRINFSSSGRNQGGVWNNTNGSSSKGTILTNAKDVDGTNGGIAIELLDNWGGNRFVRQGPGNNSGVFPETVINTYIWFSSGVHRIKIKGLDPLKTYDLAFLSSRAGGGNKTTVFSHNGQSASVNASNNFQNLAELRNVTPNADGSAIITVKKGSGSSFAYLNGMSITAKGRNADVQIQDNTASVTSVSGLFLGTFEFELTVVDDEGDESRDTVKVTIVDEVLNISPEANAGNDQVTTSTSIMLDGTSSSDPDGSIVSFLWQNISAPIGGTYNIVDPDEALTHVNNLSVGIYEFTLTVEDDSAAFDIDTVRIEIQEIVPNLPPFANAGSDQITVSTSIALDGSKSEDLDGAIVSYLWQSILSPPASSFVILNPTQAVTNVNGLIPGTYEFALTVIDDSSATATDTVQIIIEAIPNVPPVADAGPDQVTSSSSIVLNGTGSSDVDGTIDFYTWTSLLNPPGSSPVITSPNSATTDVTGLTPGLYEFALDIVDDAGATDQDTVRIEIEEIILNTPPVADAGPDQVINASSTVVNGTGSVDVDGNIVDYRWTPLSIPLATNVESSKTYLLNFRGGGSGFQGGVWNNTNSSSTKGVIANSLKDGNGNASGISVELLNNWGGNRFIVQGPGNNSGVYPENVINTYIWFNSGSHDIRLNGLDPDKTYNVDFLSSRAGSGNRTTVFSSQNQSDAVNAANNFNDLAELNGLVPAANGTITVTVSRGAGASFAYLNGMSIEEVATEVFDIENPNSAATTISGLVEGTYELQLQVTDNDGAVDQDTVLIEVTNGVATAASRVTSSSSERVVADEISSSLESIVIYPNPTYGKFEIQLGNLRSEVTIMDITGRIIRVLEGEGTKPVDISGRASGVYFIQVENDTGATTFRLVLR